MDLKAVQDNLFKSLDDLENIKDLLEYSFFSNYILLNHLKNELTALTDNEVTGFDLQNEFIKKSIDEFQEKLQDIYTQLRELK